jgi:hypothetical protein
MVEPLTYTPMCEERIMRLEISQARSSSTAFPKRFICKLRLVQPPATEEENAEQRLLLSCLCSEKKDNVTPLPENCCSTLFTTGYKKLTEGGCRDFAFWLFDGEGF